MKDSTDELRQWRITQLWEMLETYNEGPLDFVPIDEVEFRRLYRRRKIFPNVAKAEKWIVKERTMLCRDCEVVTDSGFYTVMPMTSERQDDPLQTFLSTYQLTCHGCGYTEMLPVDRDRYTRMQEEISRLRREYAHGMSRQLSPNYLGGGLSPYAMGAEQVPNALRPLRSAVNHIRDQLQVFEDARQHQSIQNIAATQMAKQMAAQVDADILKALQPEKMKRDESLYRSLQEWAATAKKAVKK